MGILGRMKTLEERYGYSKKKGELIIRVTRFSAAPSDLPPAEGQIAQQRKEGKKVIVVRVAEARA
jgi:hypothetical protein